MAAVVQLEIPFATAATAPVAAPVEAPSAPAPVAIRADHVRPAAVYHRRRVAAVVLAVMLVWGFARTASAAWDWAVGTVPEPAVATVEVQPGDTVWTVARRVLPEGDVRPLVDRITARHGTRLFPGDVLDLRP